MLFGSFGSDAERLFCHCKLCAGCLFYFYLFFFCCCEPHKKIFFFFCISGLMVWLAARWPTLISDNENLNEVLIVCENSLILNIIIPN